MRAGRLRNRVTIQTKILTTNDYGEPLESWQNTSTVWGEILPLMAGNRENFASQGAQFQARVSYQARIRWIALSPATNRLQCNGETYEISGVMDPDGRGRELVALCWAVQE